MRYVADECNVTPRNEMLIARATVVGVVVIVEVAAAAAAGVVRMRSGAGTSKTRRSVNDVKLDEHAALRT